MSDKRFEIFPQNVTKDGTLIIIQKGLKLYNISDVVELLNALYEENEQLKEEIKPLKQKEEVLNKIWRTYLENKLKEENEQQKTIQSLQEDNDKLRKLIKQNVFGMYEEGSLTDLKFKAIAYDDIVKLEISKESEPKVIVICKQGKKENVQSFCQMFIPFGISYEIKEVSGMSEKEVCDECANISLKRMYLMLLKAQELVLDINPQYKKKEILNYLVSIEHEILMLNDKGNCLDRDLFE